MQATESVQSVPAPQVPVSNINTQPTVIIVSHQRSITTYINGILKEIIKIDTVAKVSSLDEARQLIDADTENRISCLLSTDCFEGGSAGELLSHLRETHQDSHIPFIMLTEKPEHELEDILQDNLAMPLPVPFTAGKLIDKLFEVFKERDRRQSKRVQSGLSCEIKDKGSNKLIIDGTLHDISSIGCLVSLNEFLDGWNQGERYLIEFSPDDVDVIRLMARVARTVVDKDKISVGYEFVDVDNNTKWNLEKYIRDIGASS